MEIEAKFRIDTPQSFTQLLHIYTLEPYTLRAEEHPIQQCNTYYDTADKTLQKRLYGLRIREVQGKTIVTLKGPVQSQTEQGVYQRDEWEIEAQDPDPSTWPESDARTEAMKLIDGKPLLPLLTIETNRHNILVLRNDQEIAELSLDEGIISAAGRTQPFRELEIELLPAGTMSDLANLITAIREQIPLLPEHRTKLERGLMLLDTKERERSMISESFITDYHLDIAHTRYVAHLALSLFDKLQKSFAMPNKARELLAIGALLHDIGLSTDPTNHHIVGRDIVLSTTFANLDSEQRAVVAGLVAFHRKKVRPNVEPSYLSLGKKNRQMLLTLAALLRVADGLDYSHTQTTQIVSCDVSTDHIMLCVRGSHAAEDGDRAMRKADLFHKVFQHPLVVHSDGVGEGRDDKSVVEAYEGMVQVVASRYGKDTIADTVRCFLRRHFQRLVDLERKLDDDQDIEIVHDMRVSIRRLRALMPILQEIAPKKRVRYFSAELKDVAQMLGKVRDCDVFLDQVQQYLKHLPPEQHHLLSPLTESLHRDRTVAREHVLCASKTERYISFKQGFARFITDDASQWNTTLRMCDRIGSIAWRRYENLRAYETLIDFKNITPSDDNEELHNMRIAGKRLRYMLELFAEKQRASIKPLLDMLTTLQNCLGILQDIVVAKAYIATLRCSDDEQQALDAYIASREAERNHLFEELPHAWQAITQESYRRSLMEGIIHL